MINNTDRINTWQTFILIVSTINAIEVLIFPRQLAIKVGTDGWLPLIVGHFLAGIAVFFLIKLGLLFPNETFAQYAPRIAGKIVGTFFVLMAVSFWVLVTARILREFGDFIHLILDRTPPEVIVLSMLITAASVSWFGIEPITRVCEILFPLFIGLILTLILLAVPMSDFSNLLPVLTSDIKDILVSTIDITLGLEGKEILTMLLPFMTVQAQAYKAEYAALGFNLFLRLVIYIVTISVFGAEITKMFIWPVEDLGRIIAAPGQFLGRLDALFIALWVSATFSSIIIFYYLAGLSFSQLFKLKNHQVGMLVLFPIIIFISLLPKNMVKTEQFSDMVSFLFGILVFIVPLLLLAVTYIRGLHKNGQKVQRGKPKKRGRMLKNA
ncbi:MAG TPA: hypothetical protein DEA47_03085 [Peptococcaceae bacterium]|nr:MAG: Spore germination protein [Clostridia bacterium 41_269]HBT20340.1 hypothetical protein [Peptococcaceae bacterium]